VIFQSLRGLIDEGRRAMRRDFKGTYLQHDIPQLGPRIAEETPRRFWTMLARQHGGLLNAVNLYRSLAVDNETIADDLDLMVDSLLVRRLQPWHANTKKRLVKSPKIFVRDSGLTRARRCSVIRNWATHWKGLLLKAFLP